jgi:transcriptional regulator with XRE-family HTH domain
MVDFAEALGMKKESLNQYLNGKVAPGYKLLKRLSERGCNLHWLLTGKEESEVMKQLQLREIELEKELLEKDKIISKVAEAIPTYKGGKSKSES